MRLSHALRIQPGESISFSGSGGKTSALITLARELENPVIATTTTHFSKEQLGFADQIIYSRDISSANKFVDSIAPGVTLIIGEEGDNRRVSGPPAELLREIYEHAGSRGINLLIEADGSRQRALKAPAAHEPVIPPYIDQAVVVAGLSALEKPLTSQVVHRVEQFVELSKMKEGETITLEAISRVLSDDSGGLKGIPASARRICLLNQADEDDLKAKAKRLASSLKKSYHSVVITSLLLNQVTTSEKESINPLKDGCKVYGVHEPVTGIVLAAGGSQRMGKPKQLLAWKGTSLIRHTVSTVINSGLDQVIVVIGASEDRIRDELNDLPIEIISNPEWEAGQSTSVQAAISAISPNSGSAIFFLVDQPYLSQSIIHSMVERHAESLAPIIAPIIAGQRGNPVLFDRITFQDFHSLQGDVGGRKLFSRYQVSWIEWFDEALLLDIDTDEDYQRLLFDSG